MNPSPSRILVNVHASRPVIQDFCPLADSLEWEIGQSYLQERGNKAFTSDPEPVPFTINNDGNLSNRAAEVFFASLAAAEQAGTLEPTIFVLELGIGVGLFARFFLDSFRRLCAQHDKDYYDRLCYVAGDYSEKMLNDAGRHGVFDHHPGRYVFRVVDALCPEKSLCHDPLFGELAGQPFRAIFLNYLLDCLPAAVLKIDGDEVKQLCVRSCLARGADLTELGDLTGDLTAEELARMANNPGRKKSAELRRAYGLLASEYEYRPVDPAGVPYGTRALQFARWINQDSVVHSYGAIQALERLLELLRDTGFILMNDYGHARAEGAADFQHQRFSQSTFVGINFPLLKSHFTNPVPNQWIEPVEDENASIHPRLLGRRLAPETVTCFQDQFGKAALEKVQEPVELARALVKAGRFEAALTAYQQALELQPFNWTLMHEVAQFLTFSLGGPAAGLEMAKAALACNPTCSADLWNMLGDSLFELGCVEESRQAYLRALQINPADARAHFNLTFVHVRTREYAEALHRVAEALTLDKAGAYRDRLMQMQSQVLAQLTRRWQQERLWMADRVSTHQEPDRMARPSLGNGSKYGVDQDQGEQVHTSRGRP